MLEIEEAGMLSSASPRGSAQHHVPVEIGFVSGCDARSFKPITSLSGRKDASALLLNKAIRLFTYL